MSFFSLLGASLSKDLLPCQTLPADPGRCPEEGAYFIWRSQGMWRGMSDEGRTFTPAILRESSSPVHWQQAWDNGGPLLLLGEDDQPLGLVSPGVLCRLAIAAAQRQSAMIESVLSTADEMICGIDENGVVNLFNQRAEDFYKIRRQDILGKPITDFFSDLVITKVQYNAISSGEAVRDRYHQPVLGAHVLCNAAPIPGREGVLGAVTAEREITETMRLSNQLARSNTQVSNLQREIEKIHRPTDAFGKIIGQSAALTEVVQMAKKVACTDASILLRGESGTGKELFAEAIHKASLRHDKPFVVINCAAIPSALLESELFGYESGAFTGADRRGRKGKFDAANLGTVFLDEIGEMPPEMQVKLLRVLQNQKFYRVGGSQPIEVNVRVISATNRDLEQLIRQGLFRDELYYRINVVSLEIPPLRERREDIPLLTQVFVRAFCMKQGITVKRVTAAAQRALSNYSWPGNVRELSNVAERMVALSEAGDIDLEHLPALIKFEDLERENIFTGSLREAQGKNERDIITQALEKCDNDRSQAARLLGIPRSTLYYKLHKYQITGK